MYIQALKLSFFSALLFGLAITMIALTFAPDLSFKQIIMSFAAGGAIAMAICIGAHANHLFLKMR